MEAPFVNCVLRVTGPEFTSVCQYEKLCYRLKGGIDGVVHGVQYIWDTKLNTESWVFLPLYA